jgi:hypothetical protein
VEEDNQLGFEFPGLGRRKIADTPLRKLPASSPGLPSLASMLCMHFVSLLYFPVSFFLFAYPPWINKKGQAKSPSPGRLLFVDRELGLDGRKKVEA